MSSETYAKCLAKTLQYEGTFSNNPADPGGATMKGVTQRVYDAYRRRKGQATQSVRAISDGELRDIYKNQYWNVIRGDDLPAGVDAAVFDYAVNSGPVRAAKALQAAVGVPADGHIGEATLEVVSRAVPAGVIDKICAGRLRFVQGLSTFSVFGKGWSSRIASVRTFAKSLAGHPAAFDLVAAEPAPGKARSEDQKVTSTTAGKGGLLAGAGTLGTAAIDAANTIAPLGDISTVLKVVFVGLLIVGIGLTLYAAWKKARSPDAEEE